MLMRIGWIGTGVMGVSMCAHVMKHVAGTIVYSRTKAKAQPLLDCGATWADGPQAVAANADLVFTMVGFPEDVREVYFGANGLLAGARAGMVLVDMTTTTPRLAQEIATAAKARDVQTIDAPVSGGDVGAREARLSIMVGGNEDAVNRTWPLLQTMGSKIVYQGPAGSGQHAKMCNQIMIAGTMIGMCESLVYGYKAGLNLETMLESIRGGAAGCWSLDHLAPRILKRDFAPGFFVEHFIKDMSIALEEARRMNLALPGLALVHQLYVALAAQGHGKCGTQALILALEQMSQMNVAVERQTDTEPTKPTIVTLE